MAKKFLTLNIGAANIQLAEYEQDGKTAVKLVKSGVAPLAASLDGGNAETILAPALLELVRTEGFKPGPVAIAISGHMAFPKFAAIPVAGGSGEKFEKMIVNEIEQGIPFPIDEMVCDRQVLGETENGDTSVMIVAAKIDQVEALTSAVTAAGFEPTLVDVAPLAFLNAIRAISGDSDSPIVALDIGAKTTSLVIAETDKVYARSIPVAGNTVTKEIANALGCSSEEAETAKREKGYVSLGGVTEDEDEVADRISKACRAVMTRLNAEISRSINFYRSQQHGNAPVKLYITGGTSRLPQLDVFFSESLGIEVEILDPVTVLEGIALHAAGTSHFKINLLPPSIVHERTEKARIPFLVAGGIGMVLALVLVALGFDNAKAVIAEKSEEVEARVSTLKKFDTQITKAQQELEATKAEADQLRSLMAARGAAVQRLNAVKTSLQSGMWISAWGEDSVTIRYWKDRVTGAEGKTVSETVASKLKTKPGVVPESVKISHMSNIGTDGSAEEFTVKVTFK